MREVHKFQWSARGIVYGTGVDVESAMEDARDTLEKLHHLDPGTVSTSGIHVDLPAEAVIETKKFDEDIYRQLKERGVDAHCECSTEVDWLTGYVAVIYSLECETHFPKTSGLRWGRG